jgi:hypothetical protein
VKGKTMTRKGRIMKSKGNEAVALPELERMLTVTAAGQVKESSIGIGRRIVGSRPSRIVAIGAACLAFGGSAMAATGVWDPGIGSSSYDGPATIADTPVPDALSEHLGVLRRDPTAQDRSAAVEATLRGASDADGVRPDSARFLAAGSGGEATVLLSAETTAPYEAEGEEPVCVARPTGYAQEPVDTLCVGLGQLMAGRGYGEERNEITGSSAAYGLVPDGVASVTAEFGGAPDVTVPVANNYFELPLSGPELTNGGGAYEAGAEHIVMHDASGAVVPPQSAGN